MVQWKAIKRGPGTFICGTKIDTHKAHERHLPIGHRLVRTGLSAMTHADAATPSRNRLASSTVLHGKQPR